RAARALRSFPTRRSSDLDRRLAPDLTTLGDRALTAAAQRVAIDLDQEAIVERRRRAAASRHVGVRPAPDGMARLSILGPLADVRSEEHTSELQSRFDLVC